MLKNKILIKHLILSLFCLQLSYYTKAQIINGWNSFSGPLTNLFLQPNNTTLGCNNYNTLNFGQSSPTAGQVGNGITTNCTTGFNSFGQKIYTIEVGGDNFFTKSHCEWTQSVDLKLIINNTFGVATRYFSTVALKAYGGNYGANATFGIAYSNCNNPTNINYRIPLYPNAHSDNFSSCNGQTTIVKPTFEVMNGHVNLFNYSLAYGGNNDLKVSVSMGYGCKSIPLPACNTAINGNGAGGTYFKFELVEQNFNCSTIYNKNKPANEPNRVLNALANYSCVGLNIVPTYPITVGVNNVNHNISGWYLNYGTDAKRYGFLIKKTTDPDDQWELVKYINDVATYTFTNAVQYNIKPISERCGIFYCKRSYVVTILGAVPPPPPPPPPGFGLANVNSQDEVINNNLRINLSPNPVLNILKINYSNDLVKLVSTTTLNFIGKKINTQLYNSNIVSQTISTAKWPKGVYFVRCLFDNGQNKTLKIIKN